ncbi:hypothetical protein J4461_00715 [Candidatus Pacearchaeota archaeon]|nr:hypothetical protein [Candidatus Pacearchaeota archaeon]
MRRIISPEEKINKERSRNKIIVVLMLLLLVGSSAGYAFLSFGGNTNDIQEIAEGEGKAYGDGWIINRDGKQLIFRNSPEEVMNISIDSTKIIEDYSGKPVYISSESEQAMIEITNTLGAYASRVQGACYGACEKNLPEKNCSENMIIWRVNESNRVYEENSCVFIDGDMRAVDAFIYRVLGII